MSFRNYPMGSNLRSMRTGGFWTMRFSRGGLPKLKSGGTFSNKSSLGGVSAVSRSVIRTKVSEILGSDVSDVGGAVSGKVDKGLTKDYVSALEAQAKADAEAGVYGKDGKAAQLREEQMKKYVSPDRDAAIAQANKVLGSGAPGSSSIKLPGLPYTMSLTKRLSGTTAELYDESGEKFAAYDSKSGQWKSVATRAESQFQTASSSIYDEAYRAAKSKTGGGSSGLNVRA